MGVFDLTWPEAAFTLLLFLLVTVTGWLPRAGNSLGDFLYGLRSNKRAGADQAGPTRDGS